MQTVRTLDWAPLDHIEVGDLVSADAGGMPIYRVLSLEEGRAWVATREGAPARAMPLDGFRWKAA